MVTRFQSYIDRNKPLNERNNLLHTGSNDQMNDICQLTTTVFYALQFQL